MAPKLCFPLNNFVLCVCMVCMELITAMVLCARSRDSLLSASVRRVHVVFSTTGYKSKGRPCQKKHETAALRRGIQQDSFTQLESNPKALVHQRTALAVELLRLGPDCTTKLQPRTKKIGYESPDTAHKTMVVISVMKTIHAHTHTTPRRLYLMQYWLSCGTQPSSLKYYAILRG